MNSLTIACKIAVLGFIFSSARVNCFAQTSDTTAPQLGKASIKEVIAAMTLEEKAKFVVGVGRRRPPAPGTPALTTAVVPGGSPITTTPAPATASTTPPAPTGPMIGNTDQKVPGAAGTTFAIPRLGIPALVLSDGPAGVRISPKRRGDSITTYYATAFPVATLLASSWDTTLVKKVGMAFGNEVHEYGIDILLAPALNIHRNPLGGRNFEYYSEDPVVAGKMTAAIVNGIQSNGVGTSIKHFAANNQETNRNTVNTIVSERALREIYLRGFEIATKESNPWTVMSSYNKINGTYTSQSYDLLSTILHNEWGYAGFVMTDWGGGTDPIAQMKAGNDLLMPGNPDLTKAIIDAVNQKTLDEKVLDTNIARILNIILKSPAFAKYPFSNKPDLTGHAAVSRMAATEGMVLLKNQTNTLPLKNIKKIGLFGNTSYDIIAGGTGSGDVNKAYTISMVEGLKNAGYHSSDSLQTAYPAYLDDAKAKRPKPRNFFEHPAPIPEMPITKTAVEQEAKTTDIAIITLGRNAGEGADRKLENDFALSAEEKELINMVSSSFHAAGKKVVVVLNIGGVIETASWRDQADAILLAWQPGLEAGNAIADVLSGKVNPSGKLATTFPIAYKDVPSAKSFPGKEFPDQAATTATGFGRRVPAEVTYDEGIYVGYRYYNSFNVPTAYEFGYGKSYTSFAYSRLGLVAASVKLGAPVSFSEQIGVTVTVTNSGKVPGKEVVELYLSAPAKKMDKPAMELKKFAKTDLLEPGQAQVIHFNIYPKDLASFDTKNEAWVAESGVYTVRVGASSKNPVLTEKFTLDKEQVVEKDEKVLAPLVPITELKK
jgi:beta-glucosidase